MRGVEVQIEDALDKLKGAVKDLSKGIKELTKAIETDQQELMKYLQEYQWLQESMPEGRSG